LSDKLKDEANLCVLASHIANLNQVILNNKPQTKVWGLKANQCQLLQALKAGKKLKFNDRRENKAQSIASSVRLP
jgi:hypothetical protein